MAAQKVALERQRATLTGTLEEQALGLGVGVGVGLGLGVAVAVAVGVAVGVGPLEERAITEF